MPRPGRVLTAPQGTRSIKENENAPPEGGEFQNLRELSLTYVSLIKASYHCAKRISRQTRTLASNSGLRNETAWRPQNQE